MEDEVQDKVKRRRVLTEKEKASRRHNYYANRETYLARNKEYRLRNKERIRESRKAQRNGPNREKILKAKRDWGRKKFHANPDYRKNYFSSPEFKARKAEYDRAYREANRDRLKSNQKKWRDGNRERSNTLVRVRRKTNPQFALANNMRCRINIALRAAGAAKRDFRMEVAIGCTIIELMAHLEKQFTEGMTWQNRGKIGMVWHVDHIRPCSSFDLTDPVQRAECFHFTNLQPLWSVDNMRKGGARRTMRSVSLTNAA